MIKFILNDQTLEFHPNNYNQTLLEYIRENAGLSGTKEGCAEGDCGACTVLVGEIVNDQLVYKTVNSCILFIPVVHGKHVITVDYVAKLGNGLHPVQQKFSLAHATQCGFCTPGFIMSIFGLWRNNNGNSPPTKTEIESALVGNLCRCTGYRSILEGAQNALGDIQPDYLDKIECDIISTLRSIQQFQNTLSLNNNNEHFFLPSQVSEVSKLIEQYPQAQILSGGTDIGLWVTKLNKKLPHIIYLGNVSELKVIKDSNDILEIPAAVTYSQSRKYFKQLSPQLDGLLERIASLQIRNSGTIVANIANASPIGDMPPALLVIDATLKIRKGENTRLLPIKDFFLAYKKTALQNGEWIESLLINKQQDFGKLKIYKISKRFDQDISSVCAAINISYVDSHIQKIHIAFGGMAAIPKRALALENYLAGKPANSLLSETVLQKITQDFEPISDMRASAEYRRKVATNLIKKYYFEVFENCSTPLRASIGGN